MIHVITIIWQKKEEGFEVYILFEVYIYISIYIVSIFFWF